MRQAIQGKMGAELFNTWGLALIAALSAGPMALACAAGLAQSSSRGLREGFELLSSIPFFVLAPGFAISFQSLGFPSTTNLVIAVALAGVPLLSLQFEAILQRPPARLYDAALALGATRAQAFWLAKVFPTRWALSARALRFVLKILIEVAAIEIVCSIIFFETPLLFSTRLLRGSIEPLAVFFYCMIVWSLYFLSEAIFARQEALWRREA